MKKNERQRRYQEMLQRLARRCAGEGALLTLGPPLAEAQIARIPLPAPGALSPSYTDFLQLHAFARIEYTRDRASGPRVLWDFNIMDPLTAAARRAAGRRLVAFATFQLPTRLWCLDAARGGEQPVVCEDAPDQATRSYPSFDAWFEDVVTRACRHDLTGDPARFWG